MDVTMTLSISIAILSMSKYLCTRCDMHVKYDKGRKAERERERESERICSSEYL